MLPPLLIALTGVSGLADATSYLMLGHVFRRHQACSEGDSPPARAGSGGTSSARAPRSSSSSSWPPAAVVAAIGLGTAGPHVLIALPAPAMGLRNACDPKLAVAHLTTTVLTLTGIASDARTLGGPGSRLGRRLLAVAAMLIGGLLALRVGTAAPLVLAAVLVGALSLGAHLSLQRPPVGSPAQARSAPPGGRCAPPDPRAIDGRLRIDP